MSSRTRIRASRANGKRSHEPVTPEGKKRSSYNAVRHGLLSQCILLPGETPGAFDELVNQLVEHWAPVNNFEFNLIEELAAHYWRLRRTWTVETETITAAMAHQRNNG